MPLKETCPDCGYPYMVISNAGATKGKNLCPNPECATNSHVQEGNSPAAWYEGRSYDKPASKNYKRASTGDSGAKPKTAKRAAKSDGARPKAKNGPASPRTAKKTDPGVDELALARPKARAKKTDHDGKVEIAQPKAKLRAKKNVLLDSGLVEQD
jgi:hypothetical protein